MDLREIETKFKKNTFNNEDDIKLHFHSDIIKPLLEELNPEMAGQYHSEDVLKAGGRTDTSGVVSKRSPRDISVVIILSWRTLRYENSEW